MEKTTISTSSTPKVIVGSAHGNLYIKGWDRSDVTVTHAPGELTLEDQDDVIKLSCRSDCTIRIPKDSSLQIESAYGSLRIKYLDDLVTINEARGHTAINDVAEARIQKVYGHLRARRIGGDLVVEEIKGNAIIRSVMGKCTPEVVLGNIDLRDVEGEIVTNSKGNARLRLSSLSGENYIIKAGGNIHTRIPQESNVQVNFNSSSESIRIKTPEAAQTMKQKKHDVVLGSGVVKMSLKAGGSIFFSALETWESDEDVEDFTPLPEDFGDQIAEQIEIQIDEQMEMMNRHMSEQFERLSSTMSTSGLSDEEMERIMEQARVKSERANIRAQEKMRRAQEKMARKMEAARRKQEMRAKAASHRGRRKGAWSVKVPPPPPPPSDPVSEEERLMILHMLEQKKITPEEAEELLSALEGQQG